jgi:antitoxin component YwqK of YwqJK toxin-antitoxin module
MLNKSTSYFFLSLAFCLLRFTSYSQNANSNEILNGKLSSITIDSGNGVAKLFILKDAINIKCSKDIYYAWYANNKFNETQGGYHGRLVHGLFKAFYKNTNLQTMGYYNKGIKKGEWKSWYENGNLKEVLTWKNGAKNGTYLLYNEYGQKMVKANFKNNLLDGDFYAYANDKVASVKQYKKGEEKIPVIKVKKVKKTPSDSLSNSPVTPVH